MFFLKFVEFNLKAPPYSKTLHYLYFPCFCAPLPFMSFLVFSYLCPNKCFLHHENAKKGFYKEFALQCSFVAILWIIEVGGTCKMNIEIALKSSSYNRDLGRVKLSLGIFFFLSCLMESFFTSFQGLPLFLSKNTHRKAWTLLFGIILPVARTHAWFLGRTYILPTECTVKYIPCLKAILKCLNSIFNC